MGKLGVCSWSLQPPSPADLARKVSDVGVKCVQLALDPLREGRWAAEETLTILANTGVEIRSGMMAMRGEDYSTLESIRQTGGVRMDQHWAENLAAAGENGRIARRLGIHLVTFHAGFLPHERGDALRQLMIERLRAIIDRLAEHGVRVGFETGQESADTLLDILDELDRPAAGVNYDPANMILYGMGDPVEALRRLAPRVVQIHIKDAMATTAPGTWGREVPVGTGQVDWPAFFGVIRQKRLGCDLMIEREAGHDRIRDARRAREVVERSLGTEELRN
ncbi:MAG TPA: sugar phosphate isomerase/epimerase family protein [Phycisphaerae bacterium]